MDLIFGGKRRSSKKRSVRSRPHRSHKLDSKRRSKEPWERGQGARKISNPNYKPKKVRTSKGLRKVYVLRKKSHKRKSSHKRSRH